MKTLLFFFLILSIGLTSKSQTSVPTVDTVYLTRDTCMFIDFSKINDTTYVLFLSDRGGSASLPDSTIFYQAIFGVAQPHVRLKDDLSLIMYRFQRNYTIKGVSTPVRFTMYRTGAWMRELKDSAGIWKIYPYAPY